MKSLVQISARRGRALVLVVLAAGAWYASRTPGGVSRDRYGDLVHTVPTGGVPSFAERSGTDVSAVYRFAASEAGKILEWVPCYCGCEGATSSIAYGGRLRLASMGDVRAAFVRVASRQVVDVGQAISLLCRLDSP